MTIEATELAEVIRIFASSIYTLLILVCTKKKQKKRMGDSLYDAIFAEDFFFVTFQVAPARRKRWWIHPKGILGSSTKDAGVAEG